MTQATLLCALLLTLGCATSRINGEPIRAGELLHREAHDDYDGATYSFELGVHRDPDGSRTGNDWDLYYGGGNGHDLFQVITVTDDRSRIVDLGAGDWSAFDRMPIVLPEPLPENVTRDDRERAQREVADVRVGHVYAVRTVDNNSDVFTLVRVEELVPRTRVRFTWCRMPIPEALRVPPKWPWDVREGGAD